MTRTAGGDAPHAVRLTHPGAGTELTHQRAKGSGHAVYITVGQENSTDIALYYEDHGIDWPPAARQPLASRSPAVEVIAGAWSAKPRRKGRTTRPNPSS
ncbi:hypothetical protein ACFFS2_30220 [Streptomyces aurantiacus]|uniref:Uncharacterized protein n=1 Tax=Streptomyces aurantiacus TaxID=47760 RepID=A0A7G1PCU2_9ACTN|nr:hypothetical protein [Streptomyces aurantiacus]BCL33239.1 hypothetical protein GCM10017557_80980 [Streptomyces aurantiacus]